MFREMRRKQQLLPPETTEELLKNGSMGVMSVCGDEGYPYTVPVNYAYAHGVVYIHCAKAGHKLDAIRQNSKVSFCVIDQDEIVPEELTTYFRSVVAFGQASEVIDDDEKRQAMLLLSKKYAPHLEEKGKTAIEKEWKILSVLKIQIEHATGKEAIELVKARKKEIKQ